MNNGLYLITSGLLMQESRVSSISNNIANVNTAGYKRDVPIFEEYRPHDKRWPQDWIQRTLYNKTINSSVKQTESATLHAPGPIKQTLNTFDLALQNEKVFFAVETPWGIRFTRDGEFSLNEEGQLVTQDGYNLLDRTTGAPITIPQGELKPDILRNGDVAVNGAVIARIDTAYFENARALQKIGRNLYAATDALPTEPEDAGIAQGYVEMSNVSPVLEMVRMIDALRGFEMYSKMVHTYDSLNEKAANEIAKN